MLAVGDEEVEGSRGHCGLCVSIPDKVMHPCTLMIAVLQLAITEEVGGGGGVGGGFKDTHSLGRY